MVPAVQSWRRRWAPMFSWVATDTTGYSPGFDIRGSDGPQWSAKLGPEAQTEVVASRILWAIGYHQPPTYYVKELAALGRARWTAAGRALPNRHRGRESGRRLVLVEERFRRHAAVPRVDRREHSAEQLGLEDVEQQNLPACRWHAAIRRARSRGVAGKDIQLEAALDDPDRGLGQGSRNDINDFESQGFIKSVGENEVEFDFDTIYGSVVDLVRPADVRWTAELLSRLTDAQLDDAFRAADYSPDVRSRYMKKIKAKIAEGLAVS